MERKLAMGRRRDPIWKHVKQQSNGEFTCNYCEESFKGGASRIKSHLTGEKGGGIRACPSSPLNHKNKATTLCGMTSSSQEIIPSHNNNLAPFPSFADENRSDVVVDNLIVEFLISNNLPLETIEQPGFRNLLGAVARVGPGYQLPVNRSCLFKESLPIVKDVMHYIQTVRNSWNTYKCTIVVHLKQVLEFMKVYDEGILDRRKWFHEMFKCISLYSPEGVICIYELDSSYPCVDSNFGQFIHEIKQKAMLRVMPDIFCDSTLKSLQGLEFNFLTDFCVTQHIRLLLNDVCKKIGWVSELLSDVEEEYRCLPRYQPEISLAMPRDEKCDHPFFKLQAVIEHQTNLEDELWKEKTNLINAVGPLLHMLTIFDNFVPNIGYFYGAILKAELRLKHFFDLQPEKFRQLWDLFTKFEDKVLCQIHYKAAYLNPGYTFYNKNLLPDDVFELICRDKSDEDAFRKQLNLYDKKDPSLFSEEAISMLHTYHPVRWWQKFGGNVPLLQSSAIQILSQRVNCLSHFSHKHKFERQVDMLSMNAILMEEFGKLKQSDEIFKPIDLNILDTPFKL